MAEKNEKTKTEQTGVDMMSAHKPQLICFYLHPFKAGLQDCKFEVFFQNKTLFCFYLVKSLKNTFREDTSLVGLFRIKRIKTVNAQINKNVKKNFSDSIAEEKQQ